MIRTFRAFAILTLLFSIGFSVMTYFWIIMPNEAITQEKVQFVYQVSKSVSFGVQKSGLFFVADNVLYGRLYLICLLLMICNLLGVALLVFILIYRSSRGNMAIGLIFGMGLIASVFLIDGNQVNFDALNWLTAKNENFIEKVSNQQVDSESLSIEIAQHVTLSLDAFQPFVYAALYQCAMLLTLALLSLFHVRKKHETPGH